MAASKGPGDPTVALVLISFNRADELATALRSAEGRLFDEIVILDNGSEPQLVSVPGTSWLRSEENLGATGGRNLAAQHSSSDILVFIDSDAVLVSPPEMRTLARRFREDASLGLIAGLTRRPGGVIRPEEFPFRSVTRAEVPRPAPYFLECAVAVRRTAWEDAGGYDSRYVFCHGAIDLSMKLEKAGWRLEYDPLLEIEHRPASSGRLASRRTLTLRLRNRILYARRHLPLAIAIVHCAIWVAHMTLRCLPSQLGAVKDGIVEGVRMPIEREPVSFSHAWKLHKRGWRIFW